MLNKVAKIAIPDDVLDMSGATEDVETTVDITSYLPDGTSLVLAADAKVEVKVKVEPITTKPSRWMHLRLHLKIFRMRQRRRLRKIRFRLRSPERKAILRSCQQMTLQVLLILQGYGNGEHNIAVDIDVDNELYQVKPCGFRLK